MNETQRRDDRLTAAPRDTLARGRDLGAAGMALIVAALAVLTVRGLLVARR